MSEPITAQMENILDLERKEVKEVTERAMHETAEECVTQLKASSPKSEYGGKGRRKGRYARGWETVEEGDEVIVRNRTDWQLTHLLNNGHLIYNRFGGSYGRVNGDDHIGKVERWAQNEFPIRVSRGLK